jgi:hypothetical protein
MSKQATQLSGAYISSSHILREFSYDYAPPTRFTFDRRATGSASQRSNPHCGAGGAAPLDGSRLPNLVQRNPKSQLSSESWQDLNASYLYQRTAILRDHCYPAFGYVSAFMKIWGGQRHQSDPELVKYRLRPCANS